MDFVFNVAKGKIKRFAELPETNDALIMVLLKSTGLEADATLKDYDDLAALLAGTSDECDATDYVRKTLTGVTITVDDVNDRVDIDCGDVTWLGLGGAINNTLGKVLICYDNDTTAGTDANIVPVAAYDFSFTTSDSDLTVQINASGFVRAA